MDKKLGETTNSCVEKKNSIKTGNRDSWSRGTNSRLPFDIHEMLNFSRVTFRVNGKSQILYEN